MFEGPAVQGGPDWRTKITSRVVFFGIPSWEVTYPLPRHFERSVSISPLVGYVIVPWRLLFGYELFPALVSGYLLEKETGYSTRKRT